MLITIIRHGQAHGHSPTGHDQDRRLTELGHQQARAAGSYLASSAHTPGHLFASPYARTQQTLDEINAVLDLPTTTDDRLAADQGLSEMCDLIEDHRDHDSIALISHMPTVGALVTLLTQGPGVPWASLQTSEVVIVRTTNDQIIGSCELVDRHRWTD